MPKFRKRWLLWLLVAAAVYVGVVYVLVLRRSSPDEVQHAEAIVVFGAAEYDGRPSPVYRARLDHAAKLYHQGVAPLVIASGGSGGDPKFTEGVVGREYLRTLGIPDSDLIAETQGDDTATSARRIAAILRANSMNSCVAVSDAYHMFRIRQMLGHEKVKVYCSPRPNSTPRTFWKRQSALFHEIGSYTLWLVGLS
jgi:uncharacterized SAM-binding protein YcdF (DUF218 family)